MKAKTFTLLIFACSLMVAFSMPVKSNISSRAIMFDSAAKDEEYREKYLALVANIPTPNLELIDDELDELKRAYLLMGVTAFNKISFLKVTTLSTSVFRGGNHTVYEIDLPSVINVGSFQFYGNSNVKVIRIPNAKNLRQASLQGTTSLTDIYFCNVLFSETTGFPWGSTNPNTVFHFKDGDYDYQGNKLT